MNAQVDAIQQRPGEARVIAVDGIRQTRALFGGIAGVPARTRIHRRDEREARGIGRGRSRARDRDRPFLEWFAERLENGGREFRKLVEEERATVREADLARTRRRAPADEREM